MLKVTGIAAAAVLAALLLGFGMRGGSTPKAQASTTDVVVIGCEFIASAVDGDTVDATTNADYAAACGIGGTPLPATCGAAGSCDSVENLARAIGDKDGVLTAADFRGSSNVQESWDNNQLSTKSACTSAGVGCTLDVFVFVDDEGPVDIDLPANIQTQESGALDFTCDTDASFTGSVAPAGTGLITQDNDCADGTVAGKGADNNGDGVVLFHVFNQNATIGSTKTVSVGQKGVRQSFDITIVGGPQDIKLTLAESEIETNKTTTNVNNCVGTPGVPVAGNPAGTDVTEALEPPTSTLGYAVVTDADGTVLTRIPVNFSIPVLEAQDAAMLGVGNTLEGVTGNTKVTLAPTTAGAPTAAYVTICGGKGTGNADVHASFTLTPGTDIDSSQTIKVTGPPSAVALTAAPAVLACDGTQKSTVTATVKDSSGNTVANGVPVNFSVVAFGSNDPINTTTASGVASTVVSPLANSSAGVTVLVTAGDTLIATPIQSSVRVDCSLPVAAAASPVAPAAPAAGAPGAAATGRISAPNTGNGGYLGQDGSASFPVWALALVLLGAATLTAGTLVVRRAAK